MAFLDDILKFKRNDEDDFYTLLGCDESSSMEQIQAEYKIRALRLHPDKNPHDLHAAEQFQKLQVAKEYLTDASKRNKYDKWRRSGLTIPFDQWLQKKETHSSMHWAEKKKKDLMLTQTEPDTHNQQGKDLQDSVVWVPRSTESSSELIRKFRSYEI